MFYIPDKRQKEIDEKYPLTKEDYLSFSNLFYDIKFLLFLKNIPPSQYFLEVPRTMLIPFWYRNETVNDIALDKIKLYFRLLQRGNIIIWMKDYSIINKTEKTKKLQLLLGKWRIKKWDPQTRISFIPKWFEKNNIFSSIKKFLFGIKWYEIKRPGANFFLNDMLDEDIEIFMENLDYWVDFNIQMTDQNVFLSSLFNFSEQLEEKVDKSKQAEELFEYIYEQIDGKKNHPWDITISIPLKEYMDNKNFYYDILFQLHLKEYLTLKEVYLLQQNITFIIHKVYSFERNILNTLFPFYERIRFEWWNLFLDSQILVFWKKTGNKNYELIDLIVRGIKKFQKLELEYKELEEIFLLNPKNYPYIFNSLNKKRIFETLILRIQDIKDEEEQKIYRNELQKYLNKVFCLSFFNSSLSVLSNEKFEFILKEKITWIEFKANL